MSTAPASVPAPARAGLLRRLLPRPWTALWLWCAWLLLNQTTAPGHLVLGLVLALVLSRVPAAGAAPPTDRSRRGRGWRPWVALRLGAVVLWDIVVANLQVVGLVLGPQEAVKPRFVWVPLDVRRPRSITLLAGIITMTPGTVSAELSDDHLHLLVHGLDVGDPDELIAQVKSRYEAPIRALFE